MTKSRIAAKIKTALFGIANGTYYDMPTPKYEMSQCHKQHLFKYFPFHHCGCFWDMWSPVKLKDIKKKTSASAWFFFHIQVILSLEALLNNLFLLILVEFISDIKSSTFSLTQFSKAHVTYLSKTQNTGEIHKAYDQSRLLIN